MAIGIHLMKTKNHLSLLFLVLNDNTITSINVVALLINLYYIYIHFFSFA